MKPLALILILMPASLAFPFSAGAFPQEKDEPDSRLISLGINANDEVLESSGLAHSSHVKNAIWTLNDSGHPNEVLLLRTDGTLLASCALEGTQNIDWEAMAGFKIDDSTHLLIADVGDNLVKRKSCQLYLLQEPNLSADLDQTKPRIDLPIEKSARPTKIEFRYEDGPRNCEAIGVDVVGKQVWLVEKVYYDDDRKTPPGIYTLALSLAEKLAEKLAENQKPLVAKRVADFPQRNVTGMAFSPDGKRLIIRNYINAHLYSRSGDETWENVVSKTRPATVVFPLQRQGEAVCFTPDSKSVILTSELKRQPIWKVNLRQYYRPDPAESRKPDPN